MKKSDRVNSAGYAPYVERNQLMVRESNYCVFYYQLRIALSGRNI